MSFFENLNFSSANEDGETEIAALQDCNHILCLTGSGTRPLDMLLTNADLVSAFDVNPAQNSLLALKIAAIAHLDHTQCLAFLGISPCASRTNIYRNLRPYLSTETREHWDARVKIIEKGVWYAGKWEKLLAWNAFFLRLFRGKALENLLAAKTVAEQLNIWQSRIGDSRLRNVVEMIGRQWVWRWVMREPAGDHLPGPAAVGERLAQSFELAAGRFLFRESDFAMLILRGALEPQGALPVHLRKENYQRVRDHLPRLRIVQGSLTEIPALDGGKPDGFSLSDFGSYCDQANYAACWNGILKAAAPQARYCERIFMNNLAAPFPSITENHQLSQDLTARDRSIIYDIRAGVLDQNCVSSDT